MTPCGAPMPPADARLGYTEIVESEFAWEFGLAMSRELGFAPDDDVPFGEPWGMPSIVLRNGMELRKVEGENLRVASSWRSGAH